MWELDIVSVKTSSVGKNLLSSLPLKTNSWFVGNPSLHWSPASICKFPIFWSTSKVPILLSSWVPGAKSLVPSKNVICNSVLSCIGIFGLAVVSL